MSGAIQKIDKSILDTATDKLSVAESMVLILCILTGEVGMPSEKYIDFFYYSILDGSLKIGFNHKDGESKKLFNKSLQELLCSKHCIETRGGMQFYDWMFTAEKNLTDRSSMHGVDTFKSFLSAVADKCEQSDNSDGNGIDDMGVMQFVKHSLALDVKTNGCNGTVVYNAVDKTYRVLKRSTLAPIANCVANGCHCGNLQSDRNNNSDKILNLAVMSDIYLPSMTRCLEFITGKPTNTQDRVVHNSGNTAISTIVNTTALYNKYIASGKSVAGLGIPEEQQFVQAQAVKPVVTMSQVVSLPVYYYSAGDTLIVKGDGYNGKVEYTGSGWKILAGSICGNNWTNLSEEDGKFLTDLGKAGKVNPGTRLFNSDICVDTFQQAHALLAHQYNETIDTFVCVYWRPPEQPELLNKILGSPDKIRRVFG